MNSDEKMSGMKERLRQTIVVLKKLTDDLGIPYTSPEVQELKKQLDIFVRTGEPWEGRISFSVWGREAHVLLSRSGKVEVTLKVIPFVKARLRRQNVEKQKEI